MGGVAAWGGYGGWVVDGVVVTHSQIPAAIVSVIVLLMFGGALSLMLLRVLPPGNETMLNIMVGSLGTMATGVVYFWTGSTAGSQNKDKTIARNAEMLAAAQPPNGQ